MPICNQNIPFVLVSLLIGACGAGDPDPTNLAAESPNNEATAEKDLIQPFVAHLRPPSSLTREIRSRSERVC